MISHLLLTNFDINLESEVAHGVEEVGLGEHGGGAVDVTANKRGEGEDDLWRNSIGYWNCIEISIDVTIEILSIVAVEHPVNT